MPEEHGEVRLQPALLDRLTDDQPERADETRQSRVISVSRLRELVLRDLAWLLNCTNLDAAVDLAKYPHVQASVLNFGIRELTGVVASSISAPTLERQMREAVQRFEPRILDRNLKVVVTSRDEANPTALVFEIFGELWAEPVPERLYLRTQVDLETGAVEVESGG